MLYGYKLTLSQMGQIKNYKRAKKFEYTLLSIEDIELSTFEVDCEINYKKTVPLNMFEKYSIKLIEKAADISSNMSVKKIAELLHLDESLIRENLHNLEAIEMLHGVDSDMITINKDENSTYLQYENKFKIETTKEKYHLTSNEYNDINSYIIETFDKGSNKKDRKFKDYAIIGKRRAVKNVKFLNYSEQQFLLLSSNGINNPNDLKFIEHDTFSHIETSQDLPGNALCHYDEFLPILRDKLTKNRDNIIVIGSKDIDEENMEILKLAENRDNVYIVSKAKLKKSSRVFDVGINDDFVWIEDSFYMHDGNFIIQKKNHELHQIVKEHLMQYFLNKIIEIEPAYDVDELKRLTSNIVGIKGKLEKFMFKSKRDIDNEVKRLNTEKNKLYRLTDKNSSTRKKIINKIEKLERENNEHELKKYPEYIKNRKEIFDYIKRVDVLEKTRMDIESLNNELNKLNHQRLSMVSKENRAKVADIEKELKNIERLTYE